VLGEECEDERDKWNTGDSHTTKGGQKRINKDRKTVSVGNR